MLSICGTVSVLSADDDSTGNFEQDTDNDAPTFVALLDQDDIVRPDVNVEFYATAYDIDNGSTELNVTLWWSDDIFTLDNHSIEMTYSSNPAINQYRYTYTFPGQADGTYLQYYYQVYDGYTTVKEDDGGIFYDIEWKKVGRGGTPKGDEDVPVGTKPSIMFRPDFVIIVGGIGLFLILFLAAYSEREKRKNKYYHISFPTIIQDKRVIGGILLAVAFTVVLSTSYAQYTTFQYPGAALDWRIDKVGLIQSDNIGSKYDTYNGITYRHYYVEDESRYSSISWKRSGDTHFETDMIYELEERFLVGAMDIDRCIWVQTSVRSSDIAIRKVSLYTVGGVLMRGYDVAPKIEDTYNTFIYLSEIKDRLIDDGFIIRYYGSYEYDNTLRNIFLNIYFRLDIIE